MSTSQKASRKAPLVRRRLRRQDASSTRDLILSEAMRLIARDGVQELRLSDIADAIGIQTPSIYKHFVNRDTIISTLGAQMMDEMGDHLMPRMDDESTGWLNAWVRSLVWFFATRPAYARLILNDLAAPRGFGPLAAALGPVETTPQLPQVLKFTAPFRERYEKGVANGHLQVIDYSQFFSSVFGIVLITMVWPYGGQRPEMSAPEMERLQRQAITIVTALTKAN